MIFLFFFLLSKFSRLFLSSTKMVAANGTAGLQILHVLLLLLSSGLGEFPISKLNFLSFLWLPLQEKNESWRNKWVDLSVMSLSRWTWGRLRGRREEKVHEEEKGRNRLGGFKLKRENKMNQKTEQPLLTWTFTWIKPDRSVFMWLFEAQTDIAGMFADMLESDWAGTHPK